MNLRDAIQQIKSLPPDKRVAALKRLHEVLKKKEEKAKQQEEATEEMMEEAELEQSVIAQLQAQQLSPKRLEDLFKDDAPEEKPKEQRKELTDEVRRFAEQSTEQNYNRIAELRSQPRPGYETRREIYEITAAEELKRRMGYQGTQESEEKFKRIQDQAGEVRKYAETLADTIMKQQEKYTGSHQDYTR